MAQWVKNLTTMQETEEMQVQFLGQKDPLEKAMQPTTVFLRGEFHGQGSLVGYHPLGQKELDMTKWLTHTHTHTNNSLITKINVVQW